MYFDKYYKGAIKKGPESYDGKYLFKNFRKILIWFLKEPKKYANVFRQMPTLDLMIFIIYISVFELLLCNIDPKTGGYDLETKYAVFNRLNFLFSDSFREITPRSLISCSLGQTLSAASQAASLYLVLYIQQLKNIKYLDCLRIVGASYILSLFTVAHLYFYGFGLAITIALMVYVYLIMMHYGYGLSHLRSLLSYVASFIVNLVIETVATTSLTKFFTMLG